MRTFQIFGKAYGPEPVTVVAKVDNVEVFNGTVPTVNEPLPTLPTTDFEETQALTGSVIFEFTKPLDWEGVVNLNIAVFAPGSGHLILTEKTGNFLPPSDAEDVFESLENPYNYEGVTYSDPLVNVTLNGVSRQRTYDPSITGDYWWQLADTTELNGDLVIISAVQYSANYPN